MPGADVKTWRGIHSSPARSAIVRATRRGIARISGARGSLRALGFRAFVLQSSVSPQTTWSVETRANSRCPLR